MPRIDISFKSSIFRKDFPMVIATNRNTAVLLPVRLRYSASGYVAGTLLAQNNVDDLFQAYNDAGSSGIDTAKCVLFESIAAEDFDSTASTGSTTAVGIFGGCTVYKDKIVGYDANALTDLQGRVIKDATGVETILF